MTKLIRIAAATALSGFFIVSSVPALAQIEDSDARREILRMRTQIDEIGARVESRTKALGERLEAKADKKAGVDIAMENDKLRAEIAGLRGQIETLSNELANAQRRQKDLYGDLEQRLRKIEPQRVSIEGKEVEIDQAEQKAFEQADAHFKATNYQAADQAFSSFLKRYPESSYAALAHYWLGSTYFALDDCTRAMAAYQIVSGRYPNSEKAPEAMLNMASCQLELRDERGARQTLETLLKKYPASTAATIGNQRLSELR